MTDCVVSSIVTADKALQIRFVLLKERPPCSTACPPHLGDTGAGISCLEVGCLAERRGWDGKITHHLATAIDLHLNARPTTGVLVAWGCGAP